MKALAEKFNLQPVGARNAIIYEIGKYGFCIKCHGRSTEKSFFNGRKGATKFAENKM